MEELIRKLREFSSARDWGKFHSPKNLAMALSVEVSELMEHFLWLTQEESRTMTGDRLNEVKDEIGDVMIYLTMLADKFGLDPVKAAKEKIVTNRKKYPVKLAKGRMDKYRDL